MVCLSAPESCGSDMLRLSGLHCTYLMTRIPKNSKKTRYISRPAVNIVQQISCEIAVDRGLLKIFVHLLQVGSVEKYSSFTSLGSFESSSHEEQPRNRYPRSGHASRESRGGRAQTSEPIDEWIVVEFTATLNVPANLTSSLWTPRISRNTDDLTFVLLRSVCRSGGHECRRKRSIH